MKLVDIGAYNGDSALYFISYPDIDEIDAYDPNDDHIELWNSINKFYPNINFFNKAVHTANKKVTFYKRPKDLPLGSTIMPDKIQSASNEQIIVDCVDILDIVPSELFCLKVDAEGAEYDILERLMNSDKAKFVDRLYVEWHDSKMSSDNHRRQIDIINHFGDKIKNWL